EAGDQDRDVEDAAADAEEARREADEDAVQRAARERHPVAPDAAVAVDELAQRAPAIVRALSAQRDPDRGGGERDRNHRVERAARHVTDEHRAGDRPGERRGAEDETAADVDAAPAPV